MHFLTRGAAALLAAVLGTLALHTQAQTPAAPKPEALQAPVSASGQRIFEGSRTQLLQVRTLLKDQDSQASVGSGFLVDASGLAVTNYHVVSQYALRPERYRLSYTLTEGRTGALQLLGIDVIHDLALVRLVPAEGSLPFTAAPMAFRPAAQALNKGERIYSLGNPLDVGFAVVEGTYNGLVERSYLPQIFFGGALNSGMSGGPTLDEAGRVIGINVATRRDGQQVSFLVPANFAQALLERRRSAAPLVKPQYEEVTRQLKVHQAALVERFLAQPWRSANHARYRVPVPQETFMRCWGSTSPPTDKFLKFERSDCTMDQAVFVTPWLRAGAITVRHESYDGQRLGPLRYAQKYGESFRNESFGGGPAVTPPRCKEGFTDRDGLPLRTVVCLSALKRFEGLFNLAVLTTTVDHATQGVQGRLDAFGIDFNNAMRLTEHYLQGFALNQKVAP